MLLFGAAKGIKFYCQDILCILNDKFNLVLFTNSTALIIDEAKNLDNKVGYVIPCKFLSFIKTVNSKNNLDSKMETIFKFKNLRDLKELQDFIESQKGDKSYKIIKEFQEYFKNSKSKNKILRN